MHGGSIGRNSYLVAKLCPALCNNMDCSRQAPLSMEFSRIEYQSGLPFLPPQDLPDPGIKPVSPALQADSLPLSHQGSPWGELTKYRWRKQEASEVSSRRTFFYRLWNKEQGFLRWVKVPGAYVEGRSLNEGKGSSSQHRRGGSKDRYTCRQTCRYSYSNLLASVSP